jgi:hypothetical protein
LGTLDFSLGRRLTSRGAGVPRPEMSVSVATVRICRGFDCCRPLSRRGHWWRTAATRGRCGIWRWSSNGTGNRAARLPAMLSSAHS